MGIFDRFKKYAIFILIGLVFVITLFWRGFESFSEQDEPIEEEELPSPLVSDNLTEDVENELALEKVTMMVDVKGEVTHPGVYEVKSDYRIVDAIALAGGFTKIADEAQINLAQIVADEMVIYVPKEGETPPLETLLETATATSTQADDLDGVAVNTASQEELESLPGIGPSKAQAIIQHREEYGPFNETVDLLQVSGIGDKTLENIEELLIVP